jgi:hypothetical protein
MISNSTVIWPVMLYSLVDLDQHLRGRTAAVLRVEV